MNGTKAILYSVSGGVLAAAFGLLGAAQAQAEPRDTAGQPSAPVKKPPPQSSGSANAAERKQQTAEKNASALRKKAQEKTKDSSANALEKRRENSEKKEEGAARKSTAGSSNSAERRRENSEKRKEEEDRKPKPDNKGRDRRESDRAEKKDAVPQAPAPRVVVDKDTKREVGTVREVLEGAGKSRAPQGGFRDVVEDSTSAGPPMPTRQGGLLQDALDDLGSQSRDDLLDSYGRPRAQAPSDARTATSSAPPPSEEQRARQLRDQARSRLLYANPDAVPPGPPSPPLPSVAAAADAQRQREQQREATGFGVPPMTRQQATDLRRAAEERRRAEAEELAKQPEGGSVAACAGAGGSIFGVDVFGGDSCVVADGRGLGWSETGYGGVASPNPDSLKSGWSRSVGLRGSNANIDELAGFSTYGGVSLFRGPGFEGGVSVTDDGQYVSDSLGIGLGVDAAAGTRREHTTSGRWFDWEDLILFPETTTQAPGHSPATEY